MSTVGIPQSFKYLGFMRVCEQFLADLGIDVVYSGPTTKDVIDRGIGCSVSEACLPVQMIHGQVATLLGKVDKVVFPRLVSISGETVLCPKFLGMPDMIAASLGCRDRLVSPRIDLRRGPLNACLSFLRSARTLGIGRLRAARLSARDLLNTLKAHPDYDAMGPALLAHGGEGPVIGILGYPYLVQDEYASMGLLRKLFSLNARVTTANDLSRSQLDTAGEDIPKHVFWHFSDRKVKAGYHWCRNKAVDGIIHLTAFGCGPDAIAGKMVELEAKRFRIPYLTLAVDECTGEGGIQTRVEAFVDMLTRTSRRGPYGGRYLVESDVSPYGDINPSPNRVNGGVRQ